jgi:hypothetical protein
MEEGDGDDPPPSPPEGLRDVAGPLPGDYGSKEDNP